jgi:starvation-inducible DNA-binding protein
MSTKALADELTKVLADTFVLYFKTHSFHWNVKGPRFRALHEMFEEQYTELWNATDEIAERIRTLGHWAPLSWDAMVAHARLKEAGQMPDADGMIEQLAYDNKAIVEGLYDALKMAEEADDQPTVDLMADRIAVHEKAAWMLSSSMKEA